MAGAGAKLFTDGSVLNAAQVNTFLMDQSIMRFANATARDAAFGGAGEPTVAEGMMCYLDDTNVVQSYNGTSWVTIADTDAPYQNPMGLELITPTGVTGTGVSLSGAVVSFSGAATINVAGCFSSTYLNYRVMYDITSSNGSCYLVTRLRVGGSDASGSYSSVAPYYYLSGGTGYSTIQANQASSYVVTGHVQNSGAQGHGYIEFGMPYTNSTTTIEYKGGANDTNTGFEWLGGMGLHYTASQNDGFALASHNGLTVDGSLRIYGYRNS